MKTHPAVTASECVRRFENNEFNDAERWQAFYDVFVPCCLEIDDLLLHQFSAKLAKPLGLSKTKILAAIRMKRNELKKVIRPNSSTEVSIGWENKFILNQLGNRKVCSENFLLIMKNDMLFKSIQFNELAQEIEFNNSQKEPCALDDNGEAMIRVHIDVDYGLRNAAICRDALIWSAYQHKYHPVKNYFANLPKWDGNVRAETIFIDCLGAADTRYNRNIAKIILKAAFQRIFQPGVKFDLILVVRGPQGIGKSILISKLGVNWSHSSLRLTDMKDTKIAAEKIQGSWIIEIPELAGMSTAELESTKAFITSTDDVFREAYGHKVKKTKRSSIMIATTNAEHGYLRDETGGRRFIDLYCGGNAKFSPMTLTSDYISQLWSEVQTCYGNVKLFLEGNDLAQSMVDQQAQVEEDPREDIVVAYLDKPIPASWYKMSIYDRHTFLDNPDIFPDMRNSPLKLREVICIRGSLHISSKSSIGL
jgi:predicted P-loop ATPase